MKIKKIIRILSIICLSLGIIILAFVLHFVSSAISEVKDINVQLNLSRIEACEIYDIDKNNVIKNNLSQKNISLDDLNEHTINAFLSIEDKRFYEHDGLNYPRMIKSMLINIVKGEFSQGGSTISQQLVKNKYLSNEKTLKRKIKEIYLTKKLEANENKKTILESYLNTIYYGNGAYGIGNASQRFFSKHPKELTLNESCILAGVINSPTKYSPINNLNNCIRRRNLVLKEMLEDNHITDKEYRQCLNEKVVLNPSEIITYSNMDLYSQNVLHEASQILNLTKEEIMNKNYKIYTYQDPDIQSVLNDTIDNDKYYHKNQYGNIADSLAIILNNNTGGVSAIAGKSNYNLVGLRRQPGSLVKPVLIYVPALEEKIIYPCSEILDERISINNYAPRNVGDQYYGYVSIEEAVGKSLNIPAVKLCDQLGIETCKEYAKRCGLELSENDNGLAIALGGLAEGVTLQNIAESYLPFSNNGMFKKSSFISKILSPLNICVYNNKLAESQYCSPDNSYLMTEMLHKATKNGTSKKLKNCDYYIAGKTGTVNSKNSNLNTDAYSLAYTKEHTMSVWFGNYTMAKEYNLDANNNGGTHATEIIRDTFNKIYYENPPTDFEAPDTLVKADIDLIALNNRHEIFITKDLTDKYCRTEYFSVDNIPPVLNNDFENINQINFNVVTHQNNIEISVECMPYLTYKIFRIENDTNKILVDTISNQLGEVKYNDYDIQYNTQYEYYIECISPIRSIYSKKRIARINKNYDDLLISNDFDWLFT